jgi:hypothetical protein
LFLFSGENAKDCISMVLQFCFTLLLGNVHRWSQRM